MHGGWGLDALEKFFRRRRRRRRRPPGFGKRTLLEFHYGIGASGVRGSIRLVETSTAQAIFRKSCRRKNSNLQKELEKDPKRPKTGIAYKSPIKIPHSYHLKGAVM